MTIVSPERPGVIEALISTAGPVLGQALSGVQDLDVIVDIGRLTASSPTRSLLSFADVVFMVARPTPEQIVPGEEQLRQIANGRWCLIGERPYPPSEIVDKFGIPAQLIADDPRGAQALEAGGYPKRVKRSALVRSARDLGEQLDRMVNPGSLKASRPSIHEPEPAPTGLPSYPLFAPTGNDQ